jgi:hypothetical protein
VDSKSKMKTKVAIWRNEMFSDPSLFKEVYKVMEDMFSVFSRFMLFFQYSFSFSTSGAKVLDIEIAEEMLNLFLGK